MTAFYRKSITPGSQPLRPSVRAGAPPLGRGGSTPKPPTGPKTEGARKALRDWPMCDAQLVPWESAATTGCYGVRVSP